MLRRGKQDRTPADHTSLVEVVTPRTNAATITPAENLLAAISLDEPFSLEIAAGHDYRRFLTRAATPEMRSHLDHQLGAAYPQADLRHIDVQHDPTLDPARVGPDEQVAACALGLRAPAYLPLRTFRDADVDAERAAQADPVLGLLGALGDLPPGWRSLSQLVLRPAPDDWCRGYLRLAIEHPLAGERSTHGSGTTSLTSVFALAGLLVTGVLALQGYVWFEDGDWLHLAILVGGVVAAVAAVFQLVRRFSRPPIYDPKLVQEKVSRIAYRAHLRLAIFAPRTVPKAQVEARLRQVAAAYRQFNLAAGNGLQPRRLRMQGCTLTALDAMPPVRALPVLNTRELAGLWHLPQATADVPLLERTSARRRLPVPASVARGCRIGVSLQQGHEVPVCLSSDLLRRHMLLVAKTRRGKSSLLLRLAQAMMQAPPPPERPQAIVVVDPHRDLARDVLGLVPPARQRDVVYLDVAQDDRPFGLNLLDTGLGWSRDKAVENTLAIFRREFERFWGPRMQDAFRFALLTLFEANQAMCAADRDGRQRQHTILDVPALLADGAFRRHVLRSVKDPMILGWFSDYFDPLDQRLKSEIINPVQSKVHAYAGSQAATGVVGQPQSTIDPAAWLRNGSIVIVNTAKGIVGEDTAALLGSTLINLVALVVGEQASLDPAQRRRAALLVDEFHTMRGADYESILSELAKFGTSLILATQSLARLTALDAEQGKALRATVFANLDGLFVFQTSAEDALYLVRELGGQLEVDDLVELGDYQCFARLSADGERLPTFSIRLDPPPSGDPALRDHLAAESAARYGRDRAAVDDDLRCARARIEAARTIPKEHVHAAQQGTGVAKNATATGAIRQMADPRPARTAYRNLRGRAPSDAQPGFRFERPAAGAVAATHPALEVDERTGAPQEPHP